MVSATMECNLSTSKSRDILWLPFTSDSASVHHAIQSVIRALARLVGSEEDLALIEIVVTEVINNIVEHAYQRVQGRPIDLRIVRRRSEVHFSIVDQGVVMPNGEIPADVPQNFDCPVADLPEGGFGWTLIHKLARGIKYARVGDENHLRFYFSVRDSAEND